MMNVEPLSTARRDGAARPDIDVPSRPPRSSASGGLRRLLAISGPGAILAVGFVDPGGFAVVLAGGSRFGVGLLPVLLAATLLAGLLQTLGVRLGVATGQDLAATTREAFPRAAPALWLATEATLAATDLGELLGAAVALHLLFGIPIAVGVALTSLDVLLLSGIERRGVRLLEVLVLGLVFLVGASFAFDLLRSGPRSPSLLGGLLSRQSLFRDQEMLYLAIGLLGATVMPKNLYLRSSLVQTRPFDRTQRGKREAAHQATRDVTLALGCAAAISAAVLALAAHTFPGEAGRRLLAAGIEDAPRLFAPLLGAVGAGTAFALTLLAASQSAALTGTLAGQIVLVGFRKVHLAPWARRLSTRAVVIFPALAVTLLGGARSAGHLLIASQVALGLLLPFSLLPLLLLTSNRRRMGALVSPAWMSALGWIAALVVIGLDGWLVLSGVSGLLRP